MMKLVRSLCLIPLLGYICVVPSGAQMVRQPPSAEKFRPVLQWLASPAPEGRETGTRGEALAADTIASVMLKSGLCTWKKLGSDSHIQFSDYFQPFSVLRFTPAYGSILIPSGHKQSVIQLVQGKDFTSDYTFRSMDLTKPVVFAGYGIRTVEPEYNDYENIDVKDKVVMILDGYPATDDTVHAAGAAFRKLSVNDGFDLTARSREAYNQGAVALLVIPEDFFNLVKTGKIKESGIEPIYQDAFYSQLSNSLSGQVPLMQCTLSGTSALIKALHVNLRHARQHIAAHGKPASMEVHSGICIKISVKADTLVCKNVIGIVPGRDTSQSIILGAHYDHLGKHNGITYYGADDNASGVAGMLSLASSWINCSEKPACNLVFASWTAEEKGLLGSTFFVSSLPHFGKVKVYINLDMISRSESADSACRMLSIGTRTADEYLREQARRCNNLLVLPFKLDLWDVTGHHGSDYASFTAQNIPILTFNTGLHADYHTPRDIPEAVNLVKMGRVIELVDLILTELNAKTFD